MAMQIARRLRCIRRHLESLMANGEGRPSVKLGRLRRFPESQLDQWIQKKIAALKSGGDIHQSSTAK